MSRPFVLALFVFITVACGVFAQEPAGSDARIAEAVGMLDTGRYDDAVALLAPAGGPDDVRAVAKEYVRTHQGDASGHLLAGRIFEAQAFPIPALFSYMRFLALEPSSPRSAGVAARMRDLMDTIRKQKVTADGKISFASTSRKEEGDYGRVENLVWVVHNYLESDSPLLNPFHGGGGTDFQKAVFVLSELIMTELIGKEEKGVAPNFTSTVQRPFFVAMNKRSLVVPYAGLALSSLNLAGTEEWMKKNAKAVERYKAWVQSQAGK